MGGTDIGDMFVRISGDDAPFNRALARVHSNSLRTVEQLRGLETRGSASFGVLGAAAAGAAGAAAYAFSSAFSMIGGGLERLLGLFAASVKVASDFGETASKFGFLFTDATEESKASLDEFGKRVGRSRTELYNMAGDFMGVTRQMGLSNTESARLAVELSKLAVDLGSFNNVADSEAAERLTSGLIGNHEALRRLNVFISEATLKTELMKMGFKGSFEAATDQQKQLARLSIVLRDTSVAQGDAERTSGAYANQMRALWASITEVGLEIGMALIPSLQVIVQALIDGINVIRLSAPTWQAWGATASAVVTSVVAAVRELAFILYNYDLVWEGFKLAAYEKLYNTYERIIWFGQSGVAVFTWFFDNVMNVMGAVANSVVTSFMNMAENVQNIFVELWDYIASGGEDAIKMNLKSVLEGIKGLKISGLELPEFKPTNFDALKKTLDTLWGNRRNELNDKLAPKKGEAGAGAALPGLSQNQKQKLQVEIVSAEQVFRKTLLDSLKPKTDAQILQTNQAQLAELKTQTTNQATQHQELVAAVRGGGFAFT